MNTSRTVKHELVKVIKLKCHMTFDILYSSLHCNVKAVSLHPQAVSQFLCSELFNLQCVHKVVLATRARKQKFYKQKIANFSL